MKAEKVGSRRPRGESLRKEGRGQRSRRYDEVFFEFANEEGYLANEGTVIVRGGEMVLEVCPPQAEPYTLVGKPCERWFVATELGPVNGRPPVHATWAAVEHAFVGLWEEAGEEYVFWFRLEEL